ncbi:hypothetical protein PSA01_16630 [Pseudonocardia saturnea]|nr:hypothetical protein Pdca_37840 [Pseudonocardia autotrophica]GEC24634.1 hypothetical protein PSA01_16630 [Pseudonocardia saturnea]
MKQSEIVARQLSRQIIADGLAEGARLPPEKTMIEEYRVGRSTLREALRLLESRGVLTIKTGREGGPVVRHPRPSDLGESMDLVLRFNRVAPEQISAAERALFPRLVRIAAGQVTTVELAAMRECLDRMDLYVEQIPVFEEECRRFHAILLGSAQNPVLAMLLSTLNSVLDGVRADRAPTGGRDLRADRVEVTRLHHRLYDAVERGDADAAAAAADELVAVVPARVRDRPGELRGHRAGARRAD